MASEIILNMCPTNVTCCKGNKGDKGDRGAKGEKGEAGDSFEIFRTFATVENMQADTSVPEGKFVMITSSVEDEDNAKVYIRTSNGYAFIADLSGATGIKGEKGKSAYQSWLDQGNTGSEADFVASLKGEKGSDGKMPEVNLENVLTKFQVAFDTTRVTPFENGTGRGYLNMNTQGFGIVHLDFYPKASSVISGDSGGGVIATLPNDAPTPYELIEYQHGDGAVFWISRDGRQIYGRPKSTNRYIINILGYFN